MAAHPARSFGALKYTVDINAGALVSRAERAAKAAVELTGNYIKQRSNAIAPLRDGTLIASSRADTSGTKVNVSYNTVYAHYQHEGVGFRHFNGRQAKYLESVMKDPQTLATMIRYFNENMR